MWEMEVRATELSTNRRKQKYRIEVFLADMPFNLLEGGHSQHLDHAFCRFALVCSASAGFSLVLSRFKAFCEESALPATLHRNSRSVSCGVSVEAGSLASIWQYNVTPPPTATCVEQCGSVSRTTC